MPIMSARTRMTVQNLETKSTLGLGTTTASRSMATSTSGQTLAIMQTRKTTTSRMAQKLKKNSTMGLGITMTTTSTSGQTSEEHDGIWNCCKRTESLTQILIFCTEPSGAAGRVCCSCVSGTGSSRKCRSNRHMSLGKQPHPSIVRLPQRRRQKR